MYFIIYPAKAGLKSVKAGKKSITVKAKTQKGGVKFQIVVKMKGTSKWKKYTSTKTTKTIKGLMSKKQYQVKVRAYKKTGWVTWYGNWSKTKNIRIK